MKSNHTFEKSLCESARLFSLSKSQTDLFLLLQASMITYQQLSMCKIHGNTEAAGRLSLKRLEKCGYIQSKKIPDTSAAKYYFLTASGRNHLKELFPDAFTEQIHINWNRRPPSGIQQILHRIRTNDFYFTYVGSGQSRVIPWILESPLPGCSDRRQGQPPRCDGLLISPYYRYYIEQDNSTQSESVILQKIYQYQQSGLFSGKIQSLLIFCLAFPRKQPPAAKPSFSLYRILLRFTGFWSLFEDEYQIPLDYQQFIQVLESSPIRKTVSANELQAMNTLHAVHPEMETLEDAKRLKKAYLYDTSYSEMQEKEMDQLFLKRRRSHFGHIYEKYPSLLTHALTGRPLFAVPNHRLHLCQPFIMPAEYHLPDFLLKCLLYSGLNTDGWRYYCPLRVQVHDQPDYYFHQGFVHNSYGYIAIEHLLIDLSARHRLLYYFKNCPGLNSQMFFILISTDSDAADIRSQFDSIAGSNMKNNTMLLQINADAALCQDPAPLIYTTDPQKSAILFECDVFDGQMHFVRKEDNLVKL